jgi:hypothetical protein
MQIGFSDAFHGNTEQQPVISCVRHTHLMYEIPHGEGNLSGTHCALDPSALLCCLFWHY